MFTADVIHWMTSLKLHPSISPHSHSLRYVCGGVEFRLLFDSSSTGRRASWTTTAASNCTVNVNTLVRVHVHTLNPSLPYTRVASLFMKLVTGHRFTYDVRGVGDHGGKETSRQLLVQC